MTVFALQSPRKRGRGSKFIILGLTMVLLSAIVVVSSIYIRNNNISNSQIHASEVESYSITSPDGHIQISVDPDFGGVITEIRNKYISNNLNLLNFDNGIGGINFKFENINLVNQPSSYNNEFSDCTQNEANRTIVTQSGSKKGIKNSIGETLSGGEDAEEFILVEENQISLKTRLIKSSYCHDIIAQDSNSSLWDAGIYLEQRIYF
ncbi:MAG: hypothetical protein KDC90_19270, partial [Ignavibacteriae bacterium]|nr:hypothetical protein [Ignavibacteriota bacterium]